MRPRYQNMPNTPSHLYPCAGTLERQLVQALRTRVEPHAEPPAGTQPPAQPGTTAPPAAAPETIAAAAAQLAEQLTGRAAPAQGASAQVGRISDKLISWFHQMLSAAEMPDMQGYCMAAAMCSWHLKSSLTHQLHVLWLTNMQACPTLLQS